MIRKNIEQAKKLTKDFPDVANMKDLKKIETKIKKDEKNNIPISRAANVPNWDSSKRTQYSNSIEWY